MRFRFALAVAASLLSAVVPAASQDTLTIFAAASMKNAIDDINAEFTRQTGIKVSASYAASSALIRQIEQGAPADVFASADLDWMDYGAQKKLIKDESRVNLLGNKLVLIAPRASTVDTVAVAKGFDLTGLAGNERIALADVRAVPAGKYAKTALESLGSWAAAEPKIAMADNVRAALALVSRAEAALGIVYETDAKIDAGVKIVGTFPDGSHPPITYPVALTVNAKSAAARYLSYLRSQPAKVIFERYGFTFLIRPTS